MQGEQMSHIVVSKCRMQGEQVSHTGGEQASHTLYVLNVARIKSGESRQNFFATFIEKVARTKCREQ